MQALLHQHQGAPYSSGERGAEMYVGSPGILWGCRALRGLG